MPARITHRWTRHKSQILGDVVGDLDPWFKGITGARAWHLISDEVNRRIGNGFIYSHRACEQQFNAIRKRHPRFI